MTTPNARDIEIGQTLGGLAAGQMPGQEQPAQEAA